MGPFALLGSPGPPIQDRLISDPKTNSGGNIRASQTIVLHERAVTPASIRSFIRTNNKRLIVGRNNGGAGPNNS